MLAITLDDLTDASTLLRYALDPRQSPRQEADYRCACERYESRPEVRDACAATAASFGLQVLAVDALFGAVVAPAAGSPFAFDAAEFAPSARGSVVDRQRDGVLLLTIVATAFPRRGVLVGDPTVALPPFTLDEVLRTLEDAVQRAGAAAPAPDVEVADVDRPLWAILKAMPEVRETPDNRQVAKTRRGRVRTLLEKLRERGALAAEAGSGGAAWRPTWRWQVQVAAFATGGLWEAVAPVFWPADAPAPHEVR